MPSADGLTLDAAHVLETVEDAHSRMSWAREARADHLGAYAGAWYGSNNRTTRGRAVNLIAQVVNAFLPALAYNHPKPYLRPRRAMLDGETLLLSAQLEQLQEELDTGEMYRYLIVDALFSPWAVTYTGLRNARRLHEVNGAFYDAGEPFTVPVDFEDYAVDCDAKTLKGRSWEAHKFVVSKEALLADPTFADAHERIEAMNTIERAGREQNPGNRLTAGGAGASNWMTERVELWNVILYRHDGILEGTIPTRQAGSITSDWLRLAWYEGPEDGPYDHLSWNPVPSNLFPLPPIATIRSISDAIDMAMDKAIRGVKKSKKGVAYSPSTKDAAERINNAEDHFTIKTDDPAGAKVLDLNMVLDGIMPIISWMQGIGNTVAGSPNIVGGTGRIADTLGEAEILNSKANSRMQDMGQQVTKLAGKHMRKQAWFFQTDPNADYMVPLPLGPGGELIDVPMAAAERQFGPEDFRWEVMPGSMVAMDPNLRARRLVEILNVLGGLMPMFQAGVMRLDGTLRVLQQATGLSELTDMFNDPAAVMMQMAVMQAQGQAQAQAAGMASSPDAGIGPGADTTRGVRQQADPSRQDAAV